MTHRVSYSERITGQTVDIALPDNRADAWSWFNDIMDWSTSNPRRFKIEARLAMATDLYVCALFHSQALRLDPWTGRPEIDCDFQFVYAREMQFDSEGVVDYTARGHWKTTWRGLFKVTQLVVNNPEVTIGFFAHEKDAGQKHVARWGHEIEQNGIIRETWDEVFWSEPRRENAEGWSVEGGYTVKRRIRSVSPTYAAYTFVHKLPTGTRLSRFLFDDCETEATVSSEEMLSKTKTQFQSALNLAGRNPAVEINGTFHHPAGLLAAQIDLGRRSRCHAAEDVSQPAPDIAAIYDACDGTLPNGELLPKQVREIKLAGAPIFLHPLELAKQRWEKGDASYNMQMMGDPLAGLTQTLRADWVSERYKRDRYEWGRGKVIYALSDPSKGLRDPGVNLIVGVGEDGTISLLDGSRRRMSPTEWEQDMYRLCSTWDRIGERLAQIRVEEFGQATWTDNLRRSFNRFNYWGAPIVACGVNDPNRVREWNRLEPLFRQGRILLPERLIVADENGTTYDLVDYFIKQEYLKFPLPVTDDILAALSLLGEPEEKVGPLELPDGQTYGAEEEEVPDVPGAYSWMTAGFH